MTGLIESIVEHNRDAAEKLIFLEGFARGADARMEALEKRVYKLEDMVREILQRLPRFERVVSTEVGQADSEQLPQDHNRQGGAEPTGDGVPLQTGGGEAVKRNT